MCIFFFYHIFHNFKYFFNFPLSCLLLSLFSTIYRVGHYFGYFCNSYDQKSIFVIFFMLSFVPHPFEQCHRPISLLPLISKIFERAIHDQLQHFLEENKILYTVFAGV